MKDKLSRLFYVHTSLTLDVILIVGAVIEVVCGLGVDELLATYIAYPAAGLFLIAALFDVWMVIRWERQYSI